MEEAQKSGASYQVDSTILIPILLESILISIFSGYLTASIAKENKISTIVLGILLLLVGLMVQISIWHYEPVWYHFLFLFLLIPMTIFGGKLKKI